MGGRKNGDYRDVSFSDTMMILFIEVISKLWVPHFKKIKGKDTKEGTEWNKFIKLFTDLNFSLFLIELKFTYHKIHR